MKSFKLLVLFLFITQFGFGQQGYLQDFNTSGGTLTGSSINISYSIGQPVVETFSTGNLVFSNGFQQGGGNFQVIVQTDSVTCNGFNNGGATAFVVGGVPAYTYQWSNGLISATETVSGLSPGSYSVTVTDAFGFTADTTFQIFQPAVLTAVSGFFPQSQSACLDGIVQFDLNVNGGTSPYSYSWTNSANMDNPNSGNPIVNPVTTFSYVATVSDFNGCTTQASYNLLYSETGAVFEGVISYNGLPVGAGDVQVFLFPTDYTLGAFENFDNSPDSSFTDANGRFSLQGNSDDVYYYLLARPRNVNALPTSVCTYFGYNSFEHRWQDADSVFSNCGDTVSLNIPLIIRNSEIGAGHLSGTVRWNESKTQTNNDPIPLIDVVVEKDSVPLRFTTTNDTGFYEFTDLPNDGSCYRLYVNFVGLNHVYINNNPYSPCLSPSDSAIENLNFWIDTLNGGGSSAGIYNYNPTGISENDPSKFLEVNISPNPATEWMSIKIKDTNLWPVSLKIFNIAGQIVMSESKYRKTELNLRAEQFVPGMYLLEIERNGSIYRNKIVFE